MAFFDSVEPEVVAQVRAAGHRGVHNFCIGTLSTYFGLETAEASFADGLLVLTGLKGGSRMKVFAFSADVDLVRVAALQKQTVVYSQHALDLPKGSTFKEVAYDLAQVCDPASYANARKRHKRLTYPFTRLEAEAVEVRLLAAADRGEAAALHADWCAWKLAQPTTFQMMFPRRRYMQCVETAIASPADYRCYGAFKNGKLVAVRALYLEGASAFDLAFFSATFDDRLYSDFVEHFAMFTMADLYRGGALHLNCGASLNRALSSFKSHWPHYEVLSYSYSKVAT